MTGGVELAERYNRECECIGTNLPALRQRLDTNLDTHPHLFADLPVFLASRHAADMQRVVEAVEAVTHLPTYQEHVRARWRPKTRQPPPNPGVFLGFDFHITQDGPKLIEINTNAGGALLNVELLREQQSCCPGVLESLGAMRSADAHEREIVEMFKTEWRLARDGRPLRTLAIVDDAPRHQYLYPEFVRFRKLFEACGIRAVIADARELTLHADSLVHEGERIDLVYNRCTDFQFAAQEHAVLAEAFARDLAVITPHPHAHATYASKDNLVLLSDEAALRALHASPSDIETLTRAIPKTLRVLPPGLPWWKDRKQWFFKPQSGFGSRGTYRGDKITRRAFDEVMRGEYVAQRLAPPSERARSAGHDRLKLDVRCYVYGGKTQLMAARLYQGQTTNFRTAGGGFAPVYVVA